MDRKSWIGENGWKKLDRRGWMEKVGSKRMDGKSWIEENGWKKLDRRGWMEKVG